MKTLLLLLLTSIVLGSCGSERIPDHKKTKRSDTIDDFPDTPMQDFPSDTTSG